MRFSVEAGDVQVHYRGVSLGRKRKRMRECALLVVDVAKALGGAEEEPEAKKAFGFQAAVNLAESEVAPTIRHDDGEL